MSLSHRVLQKIAAMVGISEGQPINAIQALEILDTIATRVVGIHMRELALQNDRNIMRAALCAMAFDFGLNGTLTDMVLLEWPEDPPEKPADTKKVVAPEPKRLVSLH